MSTSALIALIHQASVTSGVTSTVPGTSSSARAFGHADDAGPQLAADARAQRAPTCRSCARSPRRRRDAERCASSRASSTSPSGRWKRSSRRARRRRRRRAGGSATSRRPVGRAGAGAPARRGSPPATRRQRRAVADRRGQPVEERAEQLVDARATRRARARRRSAPRAWTSHASSSGPGGITARRRRCSAALEVRERAVALEVARPGQDEVGPADREALEHRHREHASAALSASSRTPGPQRPRPRRRPAGPDRLVPRLAHSSAAAHGRARRRVRSSRRR